MGTDGLDLLVDPALDGIAWRGTDDREPAFGTAATGLLGLLERLELVLGLAARRGSELERTVALARVLAGRDGFWKESCEVDPLGTAMRLLHDRDLLALWGWNGEPIAPRLDALWSATAGCAPSIPDRLRIVIAGLPHRSIDLRSVTLLDDAGELPPLWRRVLAALAEAGVRIDVRPLAPAEATGDLAAARGPSFRPVGDGTLVLVRPHGPLAAAEEVAAALAACASLDDVVIVGGDAVLDAALVQHGLPRLGAPRGTTSASALVRLVVETAFAPMDPADLHALICAEPGPIDLALRRKLARALSSFPARGSKEWLEALRLGLEDVAAERRERVTARFGALVDPVVRRGQPLSLAQLTARLRVLATWAHGRAASVPSLRATAVLAERFVTLAQLTGKPELAHAELGRLQQELELPVLAGEAAEVGLAGVRHPASIVGAARTIVWWGFTRDSAPASPQLRLSAGERAALEAAGITPPDPGALMAAEARRWRRPLEQATGELVLVCPRTSETGERVHPHPLWDELVAGLVERTNVAKLEATRITRPARARREAVGLRPLVMPAATVTVPALSIRDLESPSSLERLLGCSLSWALERHGRLRRVLADVPGAPGPLVYGNIAHLVMERVFGTPVASPEEAARRAEAAFDGEHGTLAEALGLPDYQRQRAELRRGIVESAAEVARLLVKTGARVRGVELDVEGRLGGAALKGRSDLVLEGPDTIIDFKWGTGTHRERLESGTALQLVAYAAMTRTGEQLPQVGYLTLQQQHLLAPAGSTLPDAWQSPYSAEDMLAGATARVAERIAELAAGRLEAPSAVEDGDKGALGGGVMRLAADCRYCGFGAICGKATRS